MLGRLRNSYAEIDLSRLAQNYQALKAHSQLPICPMIKADGYGHGDIQVARVCESLGARFLGVVLIEEGVKLRLAAIQTPILVFGQFDGVGAETMVKYRLTPVLSQFDQVAKFKSALHEQAAYPVHIKFNTGMQRLGFEPEEASRIAEVFKDENYFKLEGVCTHFTSAEDFGVQGGATSRQIELFTKIQKDVRAKVKAPLIFHYLNSAGLLSKVAPKLDMARLGISLYGVLPNLNIKPDIQLFPVMSLKSHVSFTHQVRKGEKVSYGGTWQAKQDSTIAVIPLGYADGLPRVLSNKGQVLVRGVRCPITGIICMDYFMVDVTEVVQKNLGLALGDEVVIFGQQKTESISVSEVANWAGTIPYEILTGIQTRVARVYIH